jgi:hypothetical protein
VNFKSVANAIGSKIARPVIVTQKHSPTLLFGVGVVGVIGTVVLASRATLKLEGILDKAERNLNDAKELQDPSYSEQDRQQDTVKIYCQAAAEIVVVYGPAVLLGLASIGALSGAHIILNRRNAALGAAYAVLDKGFKEYRKRVIGELGEERESELRYSVIASEVVDTDKDGKVDVRTVKHVTGNGASMYARFFDENSRNWSPEYGYNQMFLQCQQNYASDRLKAYGYLFLNDVYEMLGLPRTPEGQLVGWVLDGGSSDNYVDFGVFENGEFKVRQFLNGDERSILLDFNVDGVVYNLI